MMGLGTCISFELSYFGYFWEIYAKFSGEGGVPALIQTGLASSTNQRAKPSFWFPGLPGVLHLEMS